MQEKKEPLIQSNSIIKGWAKGAMERLTKDNLEEFRKIKEKIKKTYTDYDPIGDVCFSEIITEYVKETSNILDKKLIEAKTLYEKALEQSKDVLVDDIDVINEDSFNKNKYTKQPYQFYFNEEDIIENFNLRSVRPKSNREQLILNEYKEGIYKLFGQVKSETCNEWGEYKWLGKPKAPTVNEIDVFFEIWNWGFNQDYFNKTETFSFIEHSLQELKNYAMNATDLNEKKLIESGNKNIISYRETKETYNKIRYTLDLFNNMFGLEINYNLSDENGNPQKYFKKIDEMFIKIINHTRESEEKTCSRLATEISGIPLTDYGILTYSEIKKEKNRVHNFAEFLEKYLGNIVLGIIMIFIALSFGMLGIVIDLVFLGINYEVKGQIKLLANAIDYKNYESQKAIDELEEKIEWISAC